MDATGIERGETEREDAPVIEVRPHGQRQVKFYCRYCRATHVHGNAGGPAAACGHRVAHCHVESSPYNRTGYVLVLAQGA